ncbi:hypothetical protein EV137_2324 [Kribbella pratensis]|uniref:Uncharacterized protein n=1 Tax=Kribbella pratensis TaxID=2512112 RepID=A0ABY2FPY4_9ACTN|nr:hypothetical protein EV137_2324 [Kribbella pratensis]
MASIANGYWRNRRLRSRRNHEPHAQGGWLIGIGIVGALLAALFGVMDLLAIPRGTPAFRTAVVSACWVSSA